MRSVERAHEVGAGSRARPRCLLRVAGSRQPTPVTSRGRQAQHQVVQRLPSSRSAAAARTSGSPSPANGRRPSISRRRGGSPAARSGPGSAISASSTSPSFPAGCDPTVRVTGRASAVTRRRDASTPTASSSGRSGSAARVATRRSRSTHAFGRVAPLPRSLCGLVGPAHPFDGVESSPGWPTALGALAFARGGLAVFRAGRGLRRVRQGLQSSWPVPGPEARAGGRRIRGFGDRVGGEAGRPPARGRPWRPGQLRLLRIAPQPRGQPARLRSAASAATAAAPTNAGAARSRSRFPGPAGSASPTLLAATPSRSPTRSPNSTNPSAA